MWWVVLFKILVAGEMLDEVTLNRFNHAQNPSWCFVAFGYQFCKQFVGSWKVISFSISTFCRFDNTTTTDVLIDPSLNKEFIHFSVVFRHIVSVSINTFLENTRKIKIFEAWIYLYHFVDILETCLFFSLLVFHYNRNHQVLGNKQPTLILFSSSASLF